MPDATELRAFLAEHYKHERFAGRDNETRGLDYSECVTRSHLHDLRRGLVGCISRHESRTGEAIFYDESLRILSDDEARRRLRESAAHA